LKKRWPVDVTAEEETAGNKLSSLFLIRLGGMAYYEKHSRPGISGKVRQNGPNTRQFHRRISEAN